MKVLEISPYEPPASGWVNRIKVLRREIEARHGICEILDIGPNRMVDRPGCIAVYGGLDYLRKVNRFAKRGYTVHCHINGEYFRGMLLALAALCLFRIRGQRALTTFHAGTDQDFFAGWKYPATWPFFAVIFALSHDVICNSDSVRRELTRYVPIEKVHPIQAFSIQYIDNDLGVLSEELERFIGSHDTVLCTYICFRPGFYIDVLVDALDRYLEQDPKAGIVIVGTGGAIADFCDQKQLARLSDNLLLTGNLDHAEFLALIARSALMIRTPVTDGVSATVLEALTLGIPVVGSDNGSRPDGVTTYTATDAGELAEKIQYVVKNREDLVADLPVSIVPDTAAIEVDLLAGALHAPQAVAD